MVAPLSEETLRTLNYLIFTSGIKIFTQKNGGGESGIEHTTYITYYDALTFTVGQPMLLYSSAHSKSIHIPEKKA